MLDCLEPPDISKVKSDGRRQFYGRPQLNDSEIALLNRIKKAGLQLAFVNGIPAYLCGGRKVDQRAARRLIEHGYVLPVSRGLFAGVPDQSWEVRPDPVAPPTPTSTRLRAHLGPAPMKRRAGRGRDPP